MSLSPVASKAWSYFQDEMEGIDAITDDSKKVIESLENEFNNVQASVQNAESDNARQDYLGRIYGDLELRKRETPRRAAIAYCIAFETFLRGFLIERLEPNPERLTNYLREKLLAKVSHLTDLGVNFVISVGPLNETDIDECIAVELESFQDMGAVNSIYKRLLNKDPFGQYDQRKNHVFKSLGRGTWEAAQKDIFLLFQIRHKLAHRGGKVDKKYHDRLGHCPWAKWRESKSCRDRLHDDVKRPYDQLAFPSPDEILVSTPVDSGSNKLDEIALSLLRYAQYITEVCG